MEQSGFTFNFGSTEPTNTNADFNSSSSQYGIDNTQNQYQDQMMCGEENQSAYDVPFFNGLQIPKWSFGNNSTNEKY